MTVFTIFELSNYYIYAYIFFYILVVSVVDYSNNVDYTYVFLV